MKRKREIIIHHFWSDSNIENECNGDRNRTLSVEESINNPQKIYTWKIQLTIANNFVSSNDND